MRRSLNIILAIFVLGYSLPAPLFAGALSDRQLDAIYAGAFDTDINDDITTSNSAVASQKNVGAIGSSDGTLRNTDITNRNRARVRNEGDSAAALQANVAVITAFGAGENRNNDIRNTNIATINNEVNGSAGSTDAFLDAGSSSGLASSSIFGSVATNGSSVAVQTNAGVVAVSGTLRSTDINNRNQATIRNEGGSVAGLQTNIGLISSMQAGENRDNDIRNTNRLTAQNRVTGTGGSAEADTEGIAQTGLGNNSVFSNEAALNSIAAAQTNLAALAVGGTNRNSDINNNNFASLNNRGDSTVALQANIGAIAGLGQGENRNNDIRNSNSARANNRITDNTGSVEGDLEVEAATGLGTNSLVATVNSFQSSVVMQDNLAAMAATDIIRNSSIRNTNDARVTNIPGL